MITALYFQLCIATLKLFDTLLQKEDSHIIHNLVLRNLLGRGYIQTSEPHEADSDTVINGPVEATESQEVLDTDGVEKSEQSTPEATSMSDIERELIVTLTLLHTAFT